QWLLGTWIHDSTPEYSKETWIRENDSTYSAFSYTRVRQDTVFAESRNVLMTVADVPKNDNAVTFRLISTDSRKFTFENKNHDFHELIGYTNPVNHSIQAWIESTVESEKKQVQFNFSKEK